MIGPLIAELLEDAFEFINTEMLWIFTGIGGAVFLCCAGLAIAYRRPPS